jgi:hypothetical protein
MGQLDHRTLVDLEDELRERAAARDAELMTGTSHDGRQMAAFVRFRKGVGRSGVVVLHACASDLHCALESLLASDAERGRALAARLRDPRIVPLAAVDGAATLP